MGSQESKCQYCLVWPGYGLFRSCEQQRMTCLFKPNSYHFHAQLQTQMWFFDAQPRSGRVMWPATEFHVTSKSIWIGVQGELCTGGNQKLKQVRLKAALITENQPCLHNCLDSLFTKISFCSFIPLPQSPIIIKLHMPTSTGPPCPVYVCTQRAACDMKPFNHAGRRGGDQFALESNFKRWSKKIKK